MARPRLLLDENIGSIVAATLREEGFDVKSILEDAPGSTDKHVLHLAKVEKRIVVTLDNDFGTLVFRDSKCHVGVLFLRLKRENTETIIRVISTALFQYGSKLKGKFAVAFESSIRIR